jgi:hypothetical protein
MLQQCASAAAGINADIEIAGAPASPRGISVLQLTLFAPQREGDRCPHQARLGSPGFLRDVRKLSEAVAVVRHQHRRY